MLWMKISHQTYCHSRLHLQIEVCSSESSNSSFPANFWISPFILWGHRTFISKHQNSKLCTAHEWPLRMICFTAPFTKSLCFQRQREFQSWAYLYSCLQIEPKTLTLSCTWTKTSGPDQVSAWIFPHHHLRYRTFFTICPSLPVGFKVLRLWSSSCFRYSFLLRLDSGSPNSSKEIGFYRGLMACNLVAICPPPKKH